MKRITLGILAHVDAGKTTLSEAILYNTNAIRKCGSVDEKSTVMDYDATERKRGITIYSSVASFEYGNNEYNLLDTPGHTDFSCETERTLAVLDCAVLLVSGTDGVQSHTGTLHSLLKKNGIPCFIFVNKMDISDRSQEEILSDIGEKLGINPVNMTSGEETDWIEDIASEDEALLEKYLETGSLSDEDIRMLTEKGKITPVIFGSAREQKGVDRLLFVIDRYSNPGYTDRGDRETSARVYKVAESDKGERLTFLKVTSGSIRIRQELCDGEKVTDIRKYAGEKFTSKQEIGAGEIAALTGLSKSYPGQGIGKEEDLPAPVLRPVVSYRIQPKNGVSSHTLFEALKKIEEEDPLLEVNYKLDKDELRVSLMGSVQKEVLSGVLKDRFNIETSYDAGEITYMETLAEGAEGHGHFEPLRHYADVRLRFEPAERGQGVSIKSELSTDELEINYQNQIERHIRRGLTGIMTGGVFTDVNITITGGRSHKKHTCGGDFNKAVEIAVRDAQLRAENMILEPIYHVMMEVPVEKIGRALTDIEMMHGKANTPGVSGDRAVVEGDVPVSEFGDYAEIFTSYTGGLGHLSVEPAGYMEAHDPERAREESDYDYRTDINHPFESIYVHQENPDLLDRSVNADAAGPESLSVSGVNSGQIRVKGIKKTDENTYQGMGGLEPELEAIFTRTYGEIKRYRDTEKSVTEFEKKEELEREPDKYQLKKQEKLKKQAENAKKSYIFVDGYNLIFHWKELNELSKLNFESARGKLIDLLSNYQGYMGCEMTVVFDAYRVKGQTGGKEKNGNVNVVFTRQDQTADAYIERAVHELKAAGARITVVTSDGWVQRMVSGEGALRMSAGEFEEEVKRCSV